MSSDYSEIQEIFFKHNGIESEEEKQKITKEIDSFRDVNFPKLVFEQEIINYFKEIKENNSNVMLSLDYDSDGITGGVVLLRYLKSIGINVYVYLPKRSEGYGMNSDKIKEFKNKHDIKLIITCDCGISNKNEIDFANNLGIDTIITDHHEVPEEKSDYPNAKFTIHPKVTKNLESMMEFSGSGMAFYLCYVLDKYFKSDISFDMLCGIAAIGTIGDMVPLINENRNFAKAGISSLKKGYFPVGFRKIIESDKYINIDFFNEDTLSFSIIPKINAAGRLSDPVLSFSILATDDDSEKLDKSVKKLNKFNERRKEISFDYMQSAMLMIDNKKDEVVFIAGDWLHGVLGITASDVTGKTGKPSYLMAYEGDGLYKGSVRCPEWYSVIDALRYAAKYIDYKHGGHRAAGGFSIHEKDMNLFKEKLNENYIDQLKNKKIRDNIDLDLINLVKDRLNFKKITNDIESLRPIGQGFLTPVFKSKIKLDKINSCKNGKHLFAQVKDFKPVIQAVGFGLYSEKNHDLLTYLDDYDILYSIGTDMYKRKNPYLKIRIEEIISNE